MKNKVTNTESNAITHAAKVRPVILSGGAGTRLWPISRRHYPKQFAYLVGDQSLFNATLSRVADRNRYAAPIIIGSSEHKFFILEALEQLNIKDAIVLLEPCGRNTAAAALSAAIYDQEKNPGMLHLVMPSDHLVSDEKAFHDAVTRAEKSVLDGNLVLFGINPEFPETGYGYILPGKELTGDSAVKKIDVFLEKPDESNASKLIEKGALWNSGIFFYAANTVCKEAEKLAPEHYVLCKEAVDRMKSDGYSDCQMLAEDAYIRIKSLPFDILIMEKTKNGAVLPCSMGWNDIGSWRSLWQINESKDTNGNVLLGSVVTKNVKNSYIRSEGPTIAAFGMEDCVMVATKDAVMVAPHSRSQEIKELIAIMEDSDNHNQLTVTHTCIPRPWGTYEGVAEGKNFLVKHIVVHPGRSLSRQMHHHRAEHWVVVVGTALVECDGVEKLLFPNQSVFIPQGSTHRLTNPGKIALELIEVQSGEYLKEDDIVRFEDVYGRC